MRDADAMAELIVSTVQNALGPVVERLAAAEAWLASIGDMRDRVVTLESKTADVRERLVAVQRQIDVVEHTAQAPLPHVADLQARVKTIERQPRPSLPVPTPPVDLTPIIERLVALESSLDPLDEVPARLVVLETKAMAPPPSPPVDPSDRLRVLDVQVSAVSERQAVLDGRLESLDAMRDRLVALETTVATPPPLPLVSDAPDRIAAIETRLGALMERQAVIETRVAPIEMVRDKVLALDLKLATPPPPPAIESDRLDAVETRLGALVERHAVIETRVAPLEMVRDKVMALDVKLATPLPPPLVEINPERMTAVETRVSTLLERQAVIEARLLPFDLLRDKVIALDTKLATPGPVPVEAERLEAMDRRLGSVLERQAALEARVAPLDVVRDKVVALETKTALPLPGLPFEDPRDRLATLDATIGRLVGHEQTVEARLGMLDVVREKVAALEAAQPVHVVGDDLTFTPMPLHDEEAARRIDDLAATLIRLEGHQDSLRTVLDTWTGLRDKVVTLETKAMALDAVRDLADRMVTLEQQAASKALDPLMPVQPLQLVPDVDLTPLDARLTALDQRLTALEDQMARWYSMDDKVAQVTHGLDDVRGDLVKWADRLAPLQERQAVLEATVAAPDPHAGTLAALDGSLRELSKDVGVVRERIAAVEVRAPVPGPPGIPGKDGAPGRDGAPGLNGKDGADGISADDLTVVQEDDRTLRFHGKHGKSIGTMVVPVSIYRGVWTDGRTYDRGDGVTWGGSEWHCNETTTTKPGDGTKAWTLKVKRGRDGKDGKDAPGALPVVSSGKVSS